MVTFAAVERTSQVPAQTGSYGRIGRLIAVGGQREALIAALMAGAAKMPGCRSYLIGRDVTDADAVWIVELWDSEASHAASLKLPQVRHAIVTAKPLIAGFGQSIVIEPVADVS
jgi:quinol monooxygenase YgiN